MQDGLPGLACALHDLPVYGARLTDRLSLRGHLGAGPGYQQLPSSQGELLDGGHVSLRAGLITGRYTGQPY